MSCGSCGTIGSQTGGRSGRYWRGKALLVASSGWRAAGRTLVAEKPRDLRRREVGVFEILEREAAAQLVDNLGEGRAFGGQPARQCSDADAQRFGDRFHVSPAARQQPLELVLDRSAE